MKPNSGRSLILVGCLLAASSASALRLPEVLCDHLVLQQQADVSLWGWAFAGQAVQVETSWGVKTQAVADAQGTWRVRVRTPVAQPLAQGLHPEHITFTVPNEHMVQIRDILIGEVWLCSGQSNMDMILRPGVPPGWCAWYGEASWEQESKQVERPGLRMFDVAKTPAATPQGDCVSSLPSQVLEAPDANGLIPAARRGWQVCTRETAPYFHAVPYYFGVALAETLDVPVGLVCPIVGGTPIECWMSLEALRALPGYAQATTASLNPFGGSPASLFNGMVAPLTPVTLRGALWYQGESNIGNPHYAALFQALITDWRRAFASDELPFYFVQIAPFHYGRGTQPAELREAQAAALQMKGIGMALTLDVSDVANIHPKEKRTVGRRLALQALAKTYGRTEIEADGPTPESVKAEGGALRITFGKAGGGLVARDGGPLTCFEIAGETGSFVRAEAVIEGRSVVVAQPGIPQPRAVRFAWGEADVPNLMSTNGLPVAQFRATAE